MTIVEQKDQTDRSWIGGTVVVFVVGMVLRGLSHLDQFADGPLRHWYVHLGAIAVVSVVYQLGYHLLRR